MGISQNNYMWYEHLIWKKKKLQACKPDSVQGEFTSPLIYHLSGSRPHDRDSSCLPSMDVSDTVERAAQLAATPVARYRHQPWYTWHFNTQGLSVSLVTWRDRVLLPHIFTLSTGFTPGRLFSVTLSVLKSLWDPRVTWCVALRCPDFPPRHCCRDDRSACKTQKYTPRSTW